MSITVARLHHLHSPFQLLDVLQLVIAPSSSQPPLSGTSFLKKSDLPHHYLFSDVDWKLIFSIAINSHKAIEVFSLKTSLCLPVVILLHNGLLLWSFSTSVKWQTVYCRCYQVDRFIATMCPVLPKHRAVCRAEFLCLRSRSRCQAAFRPWYHCYANSLSLTLSFSAV